MKRDMELVRKILFYLEEKEDSATSDLSLPGYSEDQLAYHCKLIHEAGLVDKYHEQRAMGGELCFYMVGNLTWEGHDFLDKIREDTVWNKTKDVIKNKGLPMVLDVIKDVASCIIQGMVQAALKGLSG